MNPTRNRSSIIYLLLFIAIISMVVYNFQQQATTQEVLSINQVAADIQSGKVERLIEDENQLRVIYTDGSESTAQKEGDATLIEQLKELGVTTEQLQPDKFNLEVKAPEDEHCARYIAHLLGEKDYNHNDALRDIIFHETTQKFLRGDKVYYPPSDPILCLQRDIYDFVLRAERKTDHVSVSKLKL